MSLSFVGWSMRFFDDTSFALCGKTIASLKRNIITGLLPALDELGFSCRERLSQHLIEISKDGRTNRYYLFGGRDESSASLIQGMTLGGVLFDEVALMPRSFVEQALARCSLADARFWFNCNPENPAHWFYEEWIKKADEKNCLYLHFLMEDNPSLSPTVIERYKKLYSGAFYERFVLGRWVAADGLVYPSLAKGGHTGEAPETEAAQYYISCDYGTVNPSSFGLWGLYGTKWYRLKEYYHASRQTGVQRTDEEYYDALCALAGDRAITAVIVDPSAASFIECIRRHGRFRVTPARNDVIDGIRRVSDALNNSKIVICPGCRDLLREAGLYRWDSGAHKDTPRKEHDHAMDDMRYFVSTVLYNSGDFFFAMAARR